MACREIKDCAKHLENDIQHLSDLLTTERSLSFGGYAGDERSLLAYGLFFFPQTFARIQFPLLETILFHGWNPPDSRPLRILDLGAGTGAASFGILHLLQQENPASPIHVTAVEQSTPSLGILKKLAADQASEYPNASFEFRQGDLVDFSSWLQPDDPPWDIVVLSFSLNEAFFGSARSVIRGWLTELAGRLSFHGIILITEPVLKEDNDRLEHLRDALVKDPAPPHVWSPCPHQQPCPLFSSNRFTCHEVRNWNPPESLSLLNRHLFREIHLLKFSFLILGKTPAPKPSDPAQVRLLAPVTQVKGRLITAGCAADGCRHEYELQTRGMDRPAIKQLCLLSRGDILHIANPKPVGSHSIMRIPDAAAIRTMFTLNPK